MPHALLALIPEMSEEKLNAMTGLFLWNVGDELVDKCRELYAREDEGYQAFQDFLDDHVFRYLGGGNSKNFEVKHYITRESVVLRVENRKGMPNALEERLRNTSVAEFFTSVFCSREANYTDKNGKVFERNLQATELCKGQDLEKQAALIKDNDARLTSALSVFSDMADFLEKLQTEHAAFPDMKLANWLMDEKGRVRISDTKSFLETSARGRIWFRHGLNEEAPLLVTPYMNPPELKASKTKAFSADKMHAYMLGKCLYQYVTAASPHVFYKKDARGRNQVITDARELDFTHPVFDGETGAALRALIEASVKNNPDERPSLSEMHAQIKALGVQHAAVQTTQAFRDAISAARSDSDTLEVKSDASFKPT